MSVTADVTTRGRTIRENVKVTVPSAGQVGTEARKPFYAGLGVVDFAVEQAKSRAPELSKLQEQVKQLPSVVLALPVTLKTQVETLQDKGTALFTELVGRGEKLAASIRRQPATQAAQGATEQAVNSAKQTASATKEAVRATEKAVEDASGKVG